MEGSTEYRAITKGRGFVYAYDTELSMGWVDPWVGLGLKGKGSPYLIAERRVPELIPVLGSQPAGEVLSLIHI